MANFVIHFMEVHITVFFICFRSKRVREKIINRYGFSSFNISYSLGYDVVVTVLDLPVDHQTLQKDCAGCIIRTSGTS